MLMKLRGMDDYAAGGEVQGYSGGKLVRGAMDMILPAAENAAKTQRSNTVPTYLKAAEHLTGVPGRILDFSAGKGLGAEAMGQKLGKRIETYEPFAQGWNPDYSKLDASDVPTAAFGGLTNLNSLNVVPREVRDQMVLDMGRSLEPGGQGIITTRGNEVMKTKGGRPGPEPSSIITGIDTYQKGFTNPELEEYLKYMLGDKYDINRLKLGPAGAMIKKK